MQKRDAKNGRIELAASTKEEKIALVKRERLMCVVRRAHENPAKAGTIMPQSLYRRSAQKLGRPLVVGLGDGDLVDHQADTTLRDDVRAAVTDLDREHGVRSADVEHRGQVHDRVGAPTDNGDQLDVLDQTFHD